VWLLHGGSTVVPQLEALSHRSGNSQLGCLLSHTMHVFTSHSQYMDILVLCCTSS